MREKNAIACAVGLLLLTAGCANGGLPSLFLGTEGVWRDRLREERYRRSFELRADARMGWRLDHTARATAKAQQPEPAGLIGERLGQAPCSYVALCEWQAREQIRAARTAAEE